MDVKPTEDDILRDALESITDAFVVYDKAGYLVTCNQNFRNLYNYSNDQTGVGTHVSDLIAHDKTTGMMPEGSSRKSLSVYLGGRKDMRLGNSGTFELTLENGQVLSVSERDTSSGGTVSIQRDITEQKHLAAASQRSSNLFQAAFHANSSVCSISVMATGQFIDVNAAWCKLTGYTREQAIGKTSLELNLWGSEHARQTLVEKIRTSLNIRDYKIHLTNIHGEIKVILLNSTVTEVDGVACLFLSAQDFTDMTEAQLALTESRGRLAEFTRASTDWFWELDHNLRFAYISPRVEQSTGIKSSDYIGLTQEETYAGSGDLPDSVKELCLKLASREPFRDMTISRKRVDTGEVTWVRASGQPFYSDTNEFLGFRGATTDVTEQVVLESHLQQAQKMEAVGQLTGGIAHDFNNLLAVIQGNAELLYESSDKFEKEAVRSIKAILRASERGADLTQSMLAFSRKQNLNPSTVSLDKEIKSMTRLIKRTLGGAIEIKMDFDDPLWLCFVDSGKLENAFLNLCLNARDAMSRGGSLNVELRNVEVDADYSIMEKGLKAGRYVTLVVSDTGSGIPADKLPHIMEPFFTTKEVGKGTGLGLSMVYGFAHQSGGHLSIYSEVDIGTTVKLFLPCVPCE
jgi:PAS domain S-box-containing protein